MLIHIDRETGKCILPSPLSSYFIEVPDDFNIFKKVEVSREEKQKINDVGEKLYNFSYPSNIEEIVENLAKENISDITSEDEGYEQRLEEEKAKFKVRPQEDFLGIEVTTEEKTPIIFKEIDIVRNEQQAIQEKVGEKEVINELDGTVESVPIYKTIYKNNFISDKMTVPIYYTENEPIMEEVAEYKMVSLMEEPEYFTLEEVLADKYKMLLLQDLTIDYLIIDTFFSGNSITSLEKAHTGKGYIEIEPQGVVKLNSVQLERPSAIFKMLEIKANGNLDFYISNKKVEQGKVELSSVINSFSLRIENNTDKPIILNAICVGY